MGSSKVVDNHEIGNKMKCQSTQLNERGASPADVHGPSEDRNPRWYPLELAHDENGGQCYRWGNETEQMWEDQLRERFGLGIGEYFGNCNGLLREIQIMPAFYIVFPDDYPISGHCAKIRKFGSNMTIVNCGLVRRRASHKDTKGYYGMGAGFVQSKYVLRKMAEESPIFRPIWEDLKGISPDDCGIYLAERPDPDLLASLQKNEEALWAEYRDTRNLDKLGLDLRQPQAWEADALFRAVWLEVAGDAAGACRVLRPMLAGDAVYWLFWVALVACLRHTHDPQGAYEVVREGLRRYPECLLFDRMGCDCCLDLKDYELAERHARRLLDMNPWGPMEMMCYALVLHNRREYMRAASLFQACAEHRTMDESAHINLGVSLARSGQEHEAIKVFRRMVEAVNPSPLALNNIAMLLAGEGQLDEAKDFCCRALELDDTMSCLWDTMGFIQLKQGQYEEAERCLLRAIELAPLFPDAWRHLLHDCHWSGQTGKLAKTCAKVGYYLPEDLERFERELGAEISD